MLRLVLAWVLVNGLLIAPLWAYTGDGETVGWIALEAALLVGMLALLPRRWWSAGLATTAAVGLVLVCVVAFVDVGFRGSLGRPINLSLDLYLAGAVYKLALGNLGMAKTVLAFVTGALGLALVTWGLARLLAPSGGKVSRLAPRLGGVAMVALFVLGLSRSGSVPWLGERMALPAVQLVKEQVEQFRLTQVERRSFAAELAATPDSYEGTPGLLGKFAGKDVLVTFIESYGMSALVDPQWKVVVRPRLDDMASRLTVAGLYVASGKLLSPTLGGQSWYAHGTMISGLWLDTQLRYDLLMASRRETLVDDFRRAGHGTAALMPAITTAWPEGTRLGYDQVFTRPDISYAGPPLFWVTMPDQFTLSFLEHTIRASAAGRPLFLEVALVSSHIPWTPIVPILDWDSVGDGAAFAPYEAYGAPPEEVWIDLGKLREDYPKSLTYSLDAVTGFAERYLDDGSLLIVLGDHDPQPWVTGKGVTREVPMHVITRDQALLEPFLAWGFQPGAVPDPHQPARRMDEFRPWFVLAFSDPSVPAAKGPLLLTGR
jgi:hypothetical protein